MPGLSHLMSVAALVLEDGGDEEEAIAAPTSAEEIERLFGRGCWDWLALHRARPRNDS